MGVFYIDCTVKNFAAPEKSAKVGELVVDTGSEFTWLPKSTLFDIGVDVRKPNQQVVMANGAVITRDVGYAILRVNGFETVDEVVFAKAMICTCWAPTRWEDSALLSMPEESN